MTTNEEKPNYTRDKIVHVAVIVICALLIVGTFIHPATRALFFWGLHVIAYNVYTIWEGLVDALTF